MRIEKLGVFLEWFELSWISTGVQEGDESSTRATSLSISRTRTLLLIFLVPSCAVFHRNESKEVCRSARS